MIPVEVERPEPVTPAPKPKADAYEPDLDRLKRLFDDHRSTTAESRTQSETDIDYRDGKQWTSTEKEALRKRHQPDTYFNRIRPAVMGMRGVIERGRSDPRAYPRTPQDDGGADVATDVLRYIADKNRFKDTIGEVFEDILVPGTGAVQIGVDADLQVTVSQIRWEEFFYDPRSRRHDFKDARYLGVAAWKYAEDVAAMYPEKRTEIEGALNSSGPGIVDGSFEDRPKDGTNPWVDRKLRRIMVVDLYHMDGGRWRRCVFHANGLLEAGDSPYKDEKGRPACNIEAASCFVDRDNNRFGVVRDMRPVQDEINKRRSKLLHHVSMRQIHAVDPQAQAMDADTARKEAARPDGVIPYGWQVAPTADIANGQIQLLQEAKTEIERQGPNPAILGRQGADASGRAVLARQQAGLVELAPIYSRLESLTLRIYRQMWARAKQFWTAPMWIRVTDDEDAPRFVGLNQPAPAPVIDPMTGQPAVDPQSGQPLTGPPQFHPPVTEDGQPHPQAGQPVHGYTNPIAEMDVDIILESEPDTANLQAEQFGLMMQLAQNPVYAQQIPFEVLFELSAFPRKRQVLDKIKASRAEQAPAMQAQQELAMRGAQAKVAETESKARLNEAKAGQAEVSTVLDAHQAGHDTAIEPAPQPAPFEAMQGVLPAPQMQ